MPVAPTMGRVHEPGYHDDGFRRVGLFEQPREWIPLGFVHRVRIGAALVRLFEPGSDSPD
jgi:hypothetical protein